MSLQSAIITAQATIRLPARIPRPGLREAMVGIRREHTARQTRKEAADAMALHHMLAEIRGDGLRAVCHRALLALGMAAALRRSELVADGRQRRPARTES